MKMSQDNMNRALFNDELSASQHNSAAQPGVRSETESQKQAILGFKTKLAFFAMSLILLASMAAYGYRQYRTATALPGYYVPQPFTQRYQFKEETFENGLKSLFIKLNQDSEKVYVG